MIVPFTRHGNDKRRNRQLHLTVINQLGQGRAAAGRLARPLHHHQAIGFEMGRLVQRLMTVARRVHLEVDLTV